MHVHLDRVSRLHGSTPVLADITLTLSPGDRIGVVGPNGVGKSTLLRLVGGIEAPDRGRVIRSNDATVGYLFQRPSDNFLPHLTVGEHLRLARGLTHRPPRIEHDELLSTLGIEERAETYSGKRVWKLVVNGSPCLRQ